MRILYFLVTSFFIFPAVVLGHGDISKLPSSVQVLQYKMALYMNSADLGTRNNLALAYIATGQIDQAEKELEVVLGKDPGNFDALDEMGLVMFRKGDMEGALKYFDRAAQINPDDIMVHVHRYVVYRSLQKHDKAAEEMGRAEALATGDEDRMRIQKEIGFLTRTSGPESSASEDRGNRR